MAHVDKYTKSAIGHLCAHYDRSAKQISNENIDVIRTKNNYNLAPNRDIGQVDFINQRCSEVRCYNRKDVNVMCSWVLTAPKDLPQKDFHCFFEESYKFMANRYGGEENVISAYVHMDEVTPHIHFAFVPVVKDRKKGHLKVSAKEAVNRMDLCTFHEDLEKQLSAVFGREIDILNEATKNGNKSIAELKRGQAVIDLQNAENKLVQVQDNIKALQEEENILKAKIHAYDGDILTMQELDSIQPQKTFTGTIKHISLQEIQNMKKTAIEYHAVKRDFFDLDREHQKVRKLVPTMQERIEHEKELRELRNENVQLRNSLQESYEKFDLLSDDEWKRIEKQYKNAKQQKKAKTKNNWDMER